MLAERLQAIHELLDQNPDTLEDRLVRVALYDEAEIAELIDQTTADPQPLRQELQHSGESALGDVRGCAESDQRQKADGDWVGLRRVWITQDLRQVVG